MSVLVTSIGELMTQDAALVLEGTDRKSVV